MVVPRGLPMIKGGIVFLPLGHPYSIGIGSLINHYLFGFIAFLLAMMFLVAMGTL
jgi:hypothetical protein